VAHCANAPSADEAVRAPSLAPRFLQKRTAIRDRFLAPLSLTD